MPVRCLLEIDCRIKPEKRREFRLNIGSSLQQSNRTRPQAVVYEDQNEPGHILIVEEWASVDTLQAYLSSDDFIAMIGGFRVLGVLHDCRVVELASGTESGGRPASIARNLKGWSQVDIGSGDRSSS
jgi:quinol monooxygenase YgiN